MGNSESTPQEEESCAANQPYNPKLVGTVKKDYKRHLILCSGQMDWTGKPEKESGTFINSLTKELKSRNLPDGEPGTLFTLCSEPNRSDKGVDIIVYPEGVYSNEEVLSEKGVRYFQVTEADLPSFVDHILKDEAPPNIHKEKVTWEHVVLVCTHGTRDKRCGRIGPQVVDQLTGMLSERNISSDKVAILGSSHLGGHKYAAVVVVYPEGDWYGQMTAKNASDLMDAYLQCKSLYPPGFRGKMGESIQQSKERVK
ncbi:altered inheritance of mitochondria protein 32 [Planoprotostelium fungivorum]|uniref:Altered inheritance of mitochondria protein 32 n=1 Tax=Planoprotostelium fungivorum TaxID=1890364 RepID=A0A2P6NW20_9EUKA|nr:altered inheritance of mitochondria protein 32 [Planoprotostelium fungivorum]